MSNNESEEMVSFDDALKIVLHSTQTMPGETVDILQARDRVLSKDIFSDVDMPPFDKSAMDGFACRSMDTDIALTLIEDIPAGYKPQKRIEKGACAKIMTGAMVPEGADCVVMVEHTCMENGKIRVLKKGGPSNICAKAEDVSAGTRVLSAGTNIGPSEIAVLASVGCVRIPVAKRPLVGIIATGNELVEPGSKPGPVQIRNSNSFQLWAQVEKSGCVPRYFGIAPDDPATTDRMIGQALMECDVVLLSGGVSTGDYDFVTDILRKNGVQLHFEKISIKPGKPTVFGTAKGKYVFGLPGNPVSTFVVFELLVRLFLSKLMGGEGRPLTVQAGLGYDLKRKKADRMEFVPVKIAEDGTVVDLEYHGSAHIHAYSKADGILRIPIGVEKIDKGTTVTIILLRESG